MRFSDGWNERSNTISCSSMASGPASRRHILLTSCGVAISSTQARGNPNNKPLSDYVREI